MSVKHSCNNGTIKLNTLNIDLKMQGMDNCKITDA